MPSTKKRVFCKGVQAFAGDSFKKGLRLYGMLFGWLPFFHVVESGIRLLQQAFGKEETSFRGGGRGGDDLVAGDVVDGGTRGVGIHDAAGEGAVDETRAVRVHDVAAVGIVGGADAQLCQQGGAKVALVHQVAHAAGSPYGTAKPEQGTVEKFRVFV